MKSQGVRARGRARSKAGLPVLSASGSERSGQGQLERGPERFDWPLANEAETLLRRHLESFLDANRYAHDLAERMREETGTDFFEWIDSLVLGAEIEPDLLKAGFVGDASTRGPHRERVFEHPVATLPRVLLGSETGTSEVALRPESVADFMARHQIDAEP